MESTGLGRKKTPLATSHGDSLADQSFQSFKSKEIRDCESPPHELGFTQRSIADPNTSGWNVVTSTEVSPDGRNYRTESLATTEGTQKLPDGHSKFAGINEQMQKKSHQGDDRNYVKTAAESSKTQLQEQTVTGDENNGRVEQKSSVVVSSSQMSTSKYSSSGTDPALDHRKVLSEFDQMVDSAIQEDNITEKQKSLSEQRKTTSTKTSEKWQSQERFEEQQEHKQKHQQSHYKEKQNERFVMQNNANEERQNTDQKRTSETNRNEQGTRKLIQEEVDQLSAAPGKIISRSVEYPDPNTKVITETKTLPDGTTVTTRKYETKSSKSQSWSSSSNQRMSSSSRTTVDDHGRVQRVEYARDTDNVDDKHQPKNLQQRKVRDRGDEEIYRNVRKDEVHEQEEASVVHREAQNRHKTDVSNATKATVREFREQKTDAGNRSVTNKTENLKDQVETFTVDSSHKTVKKDLNQAIHSQDFIENEKGCTMIDHSQRTPQKYQTEPRTEAPISQTHTSSKKHQSEHSESSHEFIQEERSKATTKSVQDFTTHGFPSVKSQKPDATGRPSKDTTPKGFPATRSTKEDSYRRESKDFSTEDFHSKKIQKHQEDITVRNDDRSTRYVEDQQQVPRRFEKDDKHHPANVPKNYKTDIKETASSKHETSTEHVKQSSVRDQQETKTIEQKTVVRESEDFTTHGFPSVRSDPSPPNKISERPKARHSVEDLQQQTDTKQISKEQQTVTSVRNEKTLLTQAALDESAKYRETRLIDNSRPADSRHPSHYTVDNDQTTKDVHVTQRNENARAQDVKIQYTSSRKPEEVDTSSPRGSVREPKQVKPQQTYYRDDERPEPARPSGGRPHQPYESHKPPQPDNDFNDASSVTTERTDISEISARNRNELTTTRISVEVDAAHEAFVRSLRCVSPVDQNRGSIRSIRTSTTSVRSSSSPDKPSRRSPSRDSDISRISSSTITKAKDQTDITRRTGSVTKQTTTPERTRPKEGTHKKDMPTLRKATESADLIKSTTEREDSRKKTTKQVTESVHQVEDVRGGKQTKTIKKSTTNTKQPLSRIPMECVDSSKRTPDKVVPSTRYSVTKPQTPVTLSNISSKHTIAQDRTNIIIENKQDQQKKHHSLTKPYTIHGSIPKEYPFGYVPRKQTFDSPDRTYPVVPKASKLSTSNNEDNKRHDRGTQPSKGTDTFYKSSGRFPLHQPEPNDDTVRSYKKSTTRNASDTDQRSTVNTSRTSKLPKQLRDESPVGDNDGRPRKLKPSEEDESSSPTLSSPSHFKSPYPELTTDLDSTDITIEVNLKRMDEDMDMTTSSNTTIPRKTYVNEKFIENEKEDLEINRRTQIDDTTTLERRKDETKSHKERQHRDDSTNSVIKETHYPNETGEPFYLIPTEPQENDGNKPTEQVKKIKPPLNRTETYDERCRQILGINRSNATITDNLITSERTSKEKDQPYNRTPLTVSAAPRKTSETNGSHYPKTTVDTLSTREETQTESSIYGTTRKSKTPSRDQSPNKEPTGEAKELYTPTSSPYSSLSRKTASKHAPSQSPSGRSSIPTFKPDDESQKKAPLPRPRSESPSKRPSVHKSIEESQTNQDYRRQDDSLPSYEYSTPKSGGTPSRSPTRPATAIQTDQRSVKTKTTVIEETKRKNTTSDHSTETSPLRKPYTTEVRYEISNRKTGKESPRQSSPSARSPTVPHHSRSPTRKAPSREVKHTNVKTTKEKVVKDTKTYTEVKSPQRSPIRECAKGSTPTASPTRKPQATPRTSPHSPSRTSAFGITKKTIRTTTKDSLDVDKKLKSTKLRSTEIVRSSEKSPITTRTPSELEPVTRKSGVSPTRRSPSKIEPGREQKLRKEIDEDNYEISRKTTTEYTSKTGRSEDESKSSHITTARIQLSPTPTRKLSSPESTGETTVKTVKSTRSISTPSPRQVSKQQKPLSPIRQSKPPGEIIITNESRTSSRTVITKKIPAKKVPVIERKKSAPVYSTVRETSQKFSRSASDNLMKTTIAKRVKPDIETTLVGSTQKQPRKSSTGKVPGKTERRPSKHLATKTINLTTPNHLINREEMDNIIIDIQQAKSSREPSPNKIIPTPVPDDVDIGKTRYPDTVQEPDEEPRRKPKINNIPILEEGTNDYIGCHITEVEESFEEEEQSTNVDRTSRTTTTYKNYDKVSEEGVADDECLLSVHDKVTKFINTAEEIKKPRTSTPFTRELPQEDFPEEDDCLLSVNAKVSKFLTTAESITKPFKSSPTKLVERNVVDEIDDELKEDECLLRVSEKVNKFVSTAEKLVASSPQRSPELVGKINRQFSRESEDIEQKSTTKSTGRPAVVERYTPRSPKHSEKPLSPKPVLKSSEAIRKAKQVFESGTTTKPKDVLSRPSVWEGKRKDTDVRLQDIGVYTTTTTGTHTEVNSVKHPKNMDNKKASGATTTNSVSSRKNLYETNISTTKVDSSQVSNMKSKRTTDEKSRSRVTPQQQGSSRSPVRGSDKNSGKRPSLEKSDIHIEKISHRTTNKHSTESSTTRDKHDYKEETSQSRVSKDSVSAKRNIFERSEHDSHIVTSTSQRTPSYMDHTVSSLEHRRDSAETSRNHSRKPSIDSNFTHETDGTTRSGKKFGVELKRVDSKHDNKVRRKSSSSEVPHIEEIFDLELLEQMLQTVVGYEQRRRIRSQIRVVKKLIETQTKDLAHVEILKYVKQERSPSRRSTPSPTRFESTTRTDTSARSTQYSEKQSEHITSNYERVTKERSSSPRFHEEKVTNVRTEKNFGSRGGKEDKPVWVTSNVLRRASGNEENEKVATKKTATTKTTRTQVQKSTVMSDEDCITSSYGIGPTDDDGKPLFGIRALKKKSQPSETKKVTGTIITETFYSENGGQPVGERKVTMYSTNPEDIDKLDSRSSHETRNRERFTKDGITTVTRLEKMSKYGNTDVSFHKYFE